MARSPDVCRMSIGEMMTNVVAVGLSTRGCRGSVENLATDLRAIVEAGADTAELALFDIDIVAGARILERRFARVEEICRSFPLRYTVHGPIASNPWDERHAAIHLETALTYVEMTRRLGGLVYVQHSGRTKGRVGHELAALRTTERDFLARVADRCGESNIRLVVENLFAERPGEISQMPHEVAEQIERLDHPAASVLIDFSHCYLEADWRGADPWASVRQAAPFTGHLHLHDSFGRSQTMSGYTASETMAFGVGDLHLPLGWGTIPWEEVFEGLVFRPDTIANIELPSRFYDEAVACVTRARRLAGLG